MLDSVGNIHKWKQQYLGEFSVLAVPPEDRAAIEYHLRCDEFDRRVCTAIDARTGESRPANPVECAEINRNALRVFRGVLATYYEVPERVLRVAVRRWGNESIETLQRMWELIREDDNRQKRDNNPDWWRRPE